jgi:hypothetical protein
MWAFVPPNPSELIPARLPVQGTFSVTTYKKKYLMSISGEKLLKFYLSTIKKCGFYVEAVISSFLLFKTAG